MTGALKPALDLLNCLVQRETVRLRAQYELSLDEFRGLYISDEQVDALIARMPGRAGPANGDVFIADLAGKALAALRADPAIGRLTSTLALVPFETMVVFWAFAPELDVKYQTLFAYLNNDVAKPYLTADLALRFAHCASLRADRAALSVQGRLVQAQVLITPEAQAHIPALSRPLHLNAAVAAFLSGDFPVDADLAEVTRLSKVVPVQWDSLPMPSETRAAFIAADVRALPICIHGPPRSGRARFTRNLLARHGPVIEVDLAALTSEQHRGRAARLSLVAMLAGAAVLVQCDDSDQTPRDRSAIAALSRRNVPVALIAESATRLRTICRDGHMIDVKRLDTGTRVAAWRHFLSEAGVADKPDGLCLVADLFQLPLEDIRHAAQSLKDYTGKLDTDMLHRAARTMSDGDMGQQAELVDDAHCLQDLVLPEPVLDQINAFVQATRYRQIVYDTWGMQRRMGASRGLTALFTGSSGTGKTMAASVIAKELRLDLYRIELSGVVSKYIGETEKNLERIFTAARAANCILFFDEADALFGKRSEVRDAHDRYANIECAYLLQRMERHDGIVILTTNLPRSIDPAFSRRIQFVVDFPKPDAELREALWRGMFPPGVPVADDVDFPFLARNFSNTGGEIRNIALDAALRAAGTDPPQVSMALLLRAVQRQMIKQGKVPTAMDFKQHFQLVSQNG